MPDCFDYQVNHIVNAHSQQNPVRRAAISSMTSLTYTYVPEYGGECTGRDVRLDFSSNRGEHALAHTLWHEARHAWQAAMCEKYGDTDRGLIFAHPDGLPNAVDAGLGGDQVGDIIDPNPDKCDEYGADGKRRRYSDASGLAEHAWAIPYWLFVLERDAWRMQSSCPGSFGLWQSLPEGEW